MSHGMVCYLDSFLRGQWYNQGQFPLSKALFVSAKQKKVSAFVLEGIST